MWHLGYGDAMNLNSDDQWTDICEDFVISNDSESDDSFNPHDCSGSEMSTSSSAVDESLVGTTSDNMSEDTDEDHWNGVWYASSEDYDSDCDDTHSNSDSVEERENSTPVIE
jgi:hypothetical protein